jgi:hypothetical protein
VLAARAVKRIKGGRLPSTRVEKKFTERLEKSDEDKELA